MQRDIEYARNTRPDTLLPDVFMVSDFPPLILKSENPPLSEILIQEIQNSFKEQYVIEDFLTLVLPVPVISPLLTEQKLSYIALNSSFNNAADLTWNQYLPVMGSSLFLAGSYERDEDLPAWLAGGYRFKEGSDFLLSAACRMKDEEDLYVLGNYQDEYISDRALFPQKLSLFVLQPDKEDFFILPRMETAVVLTDFSWQPSIAMSVDGKMESGSSEYRFRPSLGFSGGWSGGGADASLAMEYRTDSADLSFYPEGTLSIVTPDDLSFFITMTRAYFDGESRMRLGLREDHPLGLTEFTGWLDGGAGFSGQSASWDYYFKGAAKWGDFMRLENDVFSVQEDLVPYGDLQFRYKKNSKAVSDISFHAEYLNKRDLQYQFENIWYLSDNSWSLGIRTGHYNRYNEDYTCLVGNENLLYGLFTALKGETVDLIRLFMNYYPEEERLDGGITLRLSYE
ncbi:MAG: hypothetical protein B6241_03135 [Spirochaetaceae bacterium 4572_59]|nr:MAG: hypothetical protein B6241_03135 [Spirochaetaceae bacterium 4572_59]